MDDDEDDLNYADSVRLKPFVEQQNDKVIKIKIFFLKNIF
jgi:hypothetical protein